MNFFKRAILSIKRRPGKSIILLLLVFILGNIISGAISIEQAVQNTEQNLRARMPSVVTIEGDDNAMMEHAEETGEWPDVRLRPELIREIGELPYVRSFDYFVTTSLMTDELISFREGDMGGGFEGMEHLMLKGVHDLSIFDIQEGVIELVDGRVFNEQDRAALTNVDPTEVLHPVVISQDFANTNNLNLGDTFTLHNHIFEEMMGWGDADIFATETYEFQIVGLFNPLTQPNTGNEWDDQWMIEQVINRLYVLNETTEAATRFVFEQQQILFADDEWFQTGTLEDMTWIQNVFAIDDPLNIGAFRDAVTPMLPDFAVVNDMSNAFDDISSAMENLQVIASLVLWVAVGATLIILSLLIVLFLRDRKHEIGIYLALGEKKMRVVSQILLEVVVTAFIAVTLSLFTGTLISGGVSQTMLRNDLIAQQENQDDMWMGGGTSSLEWMGFHADFTIEDMIESYDISLSATTIVIFYAVGMGTILISTIAPVIYIVKLNPKKIMM